MAKFKIELNDSGNIRDILQQAMNLADEQIVQSQNEINKLANATNLYEETMESKQKYAKAINDYLGIKDKAISKKMEIAKLMTDILHHSGNMGTGSLEGGGSSKQSFDFSKIKEMVKNMHTETEETKTIGLNHK